MPSLGIKIDATPGRLNQTSALILREGVFYGQCSEICLWLDRLVDSGKISSLIFPTSWLTIGYDVGLLELSINAFNVKSPQFSNKQTGHDNMKFKLLESPLTRCRYDGGLPLKHDISNIKVCKLLTGLSNKTCYLVTLIKKVCRVSGMKSILSTLINWSKLGNPGSRMIKFSCFIWRSLSYASCPKMVAFLLGNIFSVSKKISNYLLKAWRGQDNHKGHTDKSNYRMIQNWFAYKNCHGFGRSKILFGTRGYSTISKVTSRPLVNKKLTQKIIQGFETKQWLTPELKKELNLYIENSQNSLAVLSKREGMYNKNVRWHFEKYIHNFLFQVYAIESLSLNKGSKTPGVDLLVLNNTFQSKYELLTKLRKFRTNKVLPGRRILIPKNQFEKRPLTIPSILGRATQQLVLLLLDPIIEVHSDPNSFGFRKGRSQIMAISIIQKNLQSKARFEYIDTQYIWDADIRKCFDSINHDWLLNNVPIPPKYKFLLEGWLKAGYVQFNVEHKMPTDQGIPQGGIISPLLMNFTLNGLEDLVREAALEFKENTSKAVIRIKSNDELKLGVKSVARMRRDRDFKERAIACKLVRFADDFVVISGSERLLNIIQNKFQEFLKIRGLEIHPDKSRVVNFNVNTPFDFLGYTFVYLSQTKHIRSKIVHHTKPEYRLEGRPRLFVYPSKKSLMSFKKSIIKILRESYNLNAYKLIASLNPKITGWVNYFSFSNAGGTLSALKKLLFLRLKIWLIKKHKRASIIWLMKQYMLFDEIQDQHSLSSSVMETLNLRAKNHESLRSNKWNFFGLAFKDEKGNLYEIPKLNVLKWPTNIKNIIVATVLAPARELLLSTPYLDKESWIRWSLKRSSLHENKATSLYESLWKRDKGKCFFCKNEISLEDNENDIVIHHIDPWSKTKQNKKDNLTLAHESCHFDWHSSLQGKVLNIGTKKGISKKSSQTKVSTKEEVSSKILKFSKNRTKLVRKDK